MKTIHRVRRFSAFCLLCSLLLLVNACGQAARTSGYGASSSSSTPTLTSQTATPVVQTALSCPAEGSARAAVLSPLSSDTHNALVYLSQANGDSALQRYDTFTGKTGTLLQEQGTETMQTANISTDGQWILLVSLLQIQSKSQSLLQIQSEIQLIRIDGQHLQTLYCSPAQVSIDNALLSPDNHFIVFNQDDQDDMSILYLLDLTDGTLHTEISPFQPGFPGVIPSLQAASLSSTPLFSTRNSATAHLNASRFDPVPSTHYLIYIPMRWADNSVYLLGTMHASPSPFPRLALLRDIHRDVTQQQSNVQMYATDSTPDGNPCFDYDVTPDNAQVLCSAYTLMGPAIPTTLTMQAWSGGTTHTVYRNTAGGGIVGRFLSNTGILFIMNDRTGPPALWKINNDGSGLTRLMLAQSTDTGIGFAYSSYLPWSITSRDGSFYALETSSMTGNTQSLIFGSLNGGSPRTFATNTNSLMLVGWI